MVGLRSTVAEAKQWLSDNIGNSPACPVCNRSVQRYRLPAPPAPEWVARPSDLDAADPTVREWAEYGIHVWENRKELFK